MRAALFSASLLAVLACSAATGLARCDDAGRRGAVCARLGDPFEVRVEETAHIANTRFSVRVDSVPDDSRCPSDAVCAWAGDAHIALTLREGSNADGADVHSTLQPHEVTRWGYTVELVEVQPDRLVSKALEQRDYVIKLVVRRAAT